MSYTADEIFEMAEEDQPVWPLRAIVRVLSEHGLSIVDAIDGGLFEGRTEVDFDFALPAGRVLAWLGY